MHLRGREVGPGRRQTGDRGGSFCQGYGYHLELVCPMLGVDIGYAFQIDFFPTPLSRGEL